MFLILIFFLISLVILVISSQYHKYINNLNKIIFDTIYENKDQINKQNNINNSTNINNNSLINNDTNNNNNKNKTSENQENIQKSGIPSKNESNQDKFIDYKFPSLKDSFNKAKPFIDKCAKLIFINDKTKFNSSEKPKASAIIPVYNSQNLIHRAIKSIQNQNLLDIEIILVNDFSTDKSLSVIESIQKEDPRIKIIKNKKNMGTLYSRSIGVLSSKGEYIFSLDNDDMFLDFDVFSTVTKIAKESNVDVIEFRGAMSRYARDIVNTNVQDIWFTSQKNFVLFQPELTEFSIKVGKDYDKYELNTVFIWSKCVKGSVYKKALNIIGEERYSRFMLADEDCVATFIILNTANSYRYISKYAVYNIVRRGSAIYLNKEYLNNVKVLYFADAAICFEKNIPTFKNVIPALTFNVLNLKILDKVISTDANNKKILFSFLDKVLKLDYISEGTKNEIITKGKNLKFLDYPWP